MQKYSEYVDRMLLILGQAPAHEVESLAICLMTELAKAAFRSSGGGQSRSELIDAMLVGLNEMPPNEVEAVAKNLIAVLLATLAAKSSHQEAFEFIQKIGRASCRERV